MFTLVFGYLLVSCNGITEMLCRKWGVVLYILQYLLVTEDVDVKSQLKSIKLPRLAKQRVCKWERLFYCKIVGTWLALGSCSFRDHHWAQLHLALVSWSCFCSEGGLKQWSRWMCALAFAFFGINWIQSWTFCRAGSCKEGSCFAEALCKVCSFCVLHRKTRSFYRKFLHN